MTQKEKENFMSDDMYLPIHYKGIKVEQPFFSGRGNYSIKVLEDICEQFKEYCHQQAVIKQNCMKHIVALRTIQSIPDDKIIVDDDMDTIAH